MKEPIPPWTYDPGNYEELLAPFNLTSQEKRDLLDALFQLGVHLMEQ